MKLAMSINAYLNKFNYTDNSIYNKIFSKTTPMYTIKKVKYLEYATIQLILWL